MCDSKGIPFNAETYCGHRYAYDHLPPEMAECYLVWQLVGENLADYFKVIRSFTLLEVQEGLAMKMTTTYLQEEEKSD